MTGTADSWKRVQQIYLSLTLLHTLAASLIWGINTLFLLDAGLNNAQAFAANAFFTAGLVLFEIPTGVVADSRGRRLSYLLGTFTLTISTGAYLWMWWTEAPFWAWAIVSAFLGLGFTFFSGAVHAWLVDALAASDYDGPLDEVFARGEMVQGAGMLGGSVAGGLIAQFSNLGVPYMVRAVVLVASFILAFVLMRDYGFTPEKTGVGSILRESLQHGLGNRPVRWVMLADLFTDGVSIYAFYAMQPYLLQLWGNPEAYWIAGLAAAIVGGAQMLGGFLAPRLTRWLRRRTTVLLLSVIMSALTLAVIGLFPNFWTAIALLSVWGIVFATVMPVRHAWINDLIPSKQRATVLSFDSLMGSAGGVAAQPILGRVADIGGYPASYLGSAAIQALAIPFMWLARHEHTDADIPNG